MKDFPYVIYADSGKIHRPRNQEGYLHQADQTVAQARCGSRVRVHTAEPVTKWLLTRRLLCLRCWTNAEVDALTVQRDQVRGWNR